MPNLNESILSLMFIFVIVCFDLISLIVSHPCQIQLTKTNLANNMPPIIKNGKLNSAWDSNSKKFYQASKNTDIEYFYFISTLPNRTFQEQITTKLYSNDTTNATPDVALIKSVSQIHTNIKQKVIEVKYNCKEIYDTFIQLSLTLTIKSCQSPITINWIKKCEPKNLPLISIGLTTHKNDIMVNGKFNEHNQDIFSDKKRKIERMLIPKEMNSLRLFLSYFGVNGELKMFKPEVIVNSNNLQVLSLGWLGNGGNVLPTPHDIVVHFVCMRYRISTNDVQVSLNFEGYDPINLIFEKKCNTISEVQEYFTILFIIYWTILFVMIFLLIVVIMYFLKATNTSITEILNAAIDIICCRKNKSPRYEEEEIKTLRSETGGHSEESDKSNTDESGDSIIEDKHLNINMSRFNDKKKNMNVGDYGGI